MTFRPARHLEFLERLVGALGITGSVKRVVIDASCDSAVMVYVQRYLDEDEGRKMTNLLADPRSPRPHVVEAEVVIDDGGNVHRIG